jgi:hypothetical protein
MVIRYLYIALLMLGMELVRAEETPPPFPTDPQSAQERTSFQTAKP